MGIKILALQLLKSQLNAIVRERWNVLIAYCTVMDRAILTANLAKDVRGS